jgi:hypothetical protein
MINRVIRYKTCFLINETIWDFFDFHWRCVDESINHTVWYYISIELDEITCQSMNSIKNELSDCLQQLTSEMNE